MKCNLTHKAIEMVYNLVVAHGKGVYSAVDNIANKLNLSDDERQYVEDEALSWK